MARYGVLAVLAAVALSACSTSTGKDAKGVQSNSGNTKHPPAADVTVAACTNDSTINSATAKLTIVNHSSKRSNYTVEVSFVDASGAQVGNGFAAANNVEPGQTAKTDAVDITSGKASKCQIKDVERYAS